MKKKLLVLTTAIVMTFSITFAQDIKPVPDYISNTLQQEFKSASNVQWKTTSNFYKANFTIDGNPLEAFYSFDGKLIGTSRALSVEQLPMSLIKEVKEKEANYKITELFELLTDRGTEYYITYKSDKDTKTYKSDGYSWSRY